MKLSRKRLLLSLSSGTTIYLLIFLFQDDNIFLSSLTPFSVAALFGSYCLWILLIYVVLALRKSEESLRKVEKWDSPKALGLTLILLWVVCAVLYYWRPYKWVFFYGIAFSIANLTGAYMRNIYRKSKK